MEKSNQFYDPYNFNNAQGAYNNQMSPYDGLDMVMPPPNSSQISQYEQQYMYYRYLSQMMDYKIKTKEFERISKEEK